MRTILLIATLLVSSSAFAEYAGELAIDMTGKAYVGAMEDAGSVDAGVAVVVMAPVTVVGEVDGGFQVDVQTEVAMVKTVFNGVKSGNWWLAAGAFLVLVVSLLRSAGKKFHEWLPDNNILDKPLIFIYDTKVGGWVLNWLTALAGGIGTAMLAGVAVDFSLWKSVLMVSTSGSALFELYSDIMAWWKARAAKKAAAPAPVPAPAPVVEPAKPVEPPKP